MEHAIPALVIAAIIVVGGVILADATRGSLQTVDESWRDIEAISEERLGTDLTVVSTQVTDGGATVTAVIKNQGRTSITEPSNGPDNQLRRHGRSALRVHAHTRPAPGDNQ
jgi:hypothetical protein